MAKKMLFLIAVCMISGCESLQGMNDKYALLEIDREKAVMDFPCPPSLPLADPQHMTADEYKSWRAEMDCRNARQREVREMQNDYANFQDSIQPNVVIAVPAN